VREQRVEIGIIVMGFIVVFVSIFIVVIKVQVAPYVIVQNLESVRSERKGRHLNQVGAYVCAHSVCLNSASTVSSAKGKW
jgi:hypothetical protein